MLDDGASSLQVTPYSRAVGLCRNTRRNTHTHTCLCSYPLRRIARHTSLCPCQLARGASTFALWQAQSPCGSQSTPLSIPTRVTSLRSVSVCVCVCVCVEGVICTRTRVCIYTELKTCACNHTRIFTEACTHTHINAHTQAQIIHGNKFAKAVQKREEMEKRRKEAARPRKLENRLWKLCVCSCMGGEDRCIVRWGLSNECQFSPEIEDEKAEICQELASLGWTMEATVAGLCKQHWQGSVSGEEGGEAPQG